MTSKLSVFPNEILLQIFGSLPRKDLSKLSLVDVKCRDLAFDILRQDALRIWNQAQTESTPLYRSIKQLASQKDLESS